MPTGTDQPSSFFLLAPITAVRSVGTRSAARLAKLGIRVVRHLLWHIPSRYEDYSAVVPISEITPGEKQSIQGEVVAIATRFIWPRRMSVTTATVRDDSGAVRATWFNRPYLSDMLTEGTRVSLAGKAVLDKRGLYLSNPSYERTNGTVADMGAEQLCHTGRLVPVYPETEGVTSKFLRYLIQPLLERLEGIPDPLPAAMRREYGLPELSTALQTVHYPAAIADVDAAKARLAFDDILLLQLKALSERRLLNLRRAPTLTLDVAYMKKAVAVLPFTLTHDQRVAAFEILKDMERAFPMNRLLEGDVGSGKTAVALLAAFHVAHAGRQTALLAPTEVLAQQHAATLAPMAKATGIRYALMTGSGTWADGKSVPRARLLRAIANKEIPIVIGTHAILEDRVTMPALALVVVDEQHRFGIAQRAALVQPGRHASATVPHLLSMTATPIPRTLALTVFGDLDISIIREKPAGRLPIVTKVMGTRQRKDTEAFIREHIREGRQAFVICPRIEVPPTDEKDAPAGKPLRQKKLQPLWAEVKAVEEEHRRLSQEVFPDLRVVMLHGRMPARQKERVMREFKQGWHDILVSTSVIEVGVDIPNATVMVIEGADRFGLAQLHQFRGRIGRGSDQSYCFLAASDDSMAKRRLETLVKTDDGFALAEADLKFRGPGEFFGVRQSGMSDIAMTALADPELVKKARLAARTIMKVDPTLKKHPLLRELVDQFGRLVHSE
ncbi:MAG TPA: ATP-dependent DNA helicase RecG [Candidatus Paceibacterota bacterium]|nr:ATP-dependent DNA helicase RecG [Candidatus Paceibacterota bacterium]